MHQKRLAVGNPRTVWENLQRMSPKMPKGYQGVDAVDRGWAELAPKAAEILREWQLLNVK